MSTHEQPAVLPTVETEQARSNRLYAMLSHINRTIVRVEDPSELYEAACCIAVEHGGFNYAWIGLVEPAGQRIVPAANAGLTLDPRQLCLTTDPERPEGRGPSANAIRTGRPCIANDTQSEEGMSPWQGPMSRWQVCAVASFPLRLEGRIIGAFTVTAGQRDFFREAEARLLAEVADDLSFALETMRREEKRAAAESKVRFLAYYDAQTGLPGRALFTERLEHACAETPDSNRAVLVINLRRYHGILQVLGQAEGPTIARAVASRLESLLPASIIGRLSESEFAFVLDDTAGLHLIEEAAWRAHEAVAAAIPVSSSEVFLDPFIGIALWPQDGSAAELLKHAKIAAAWPAQDATSFCRFFAREMDRNSRRQLDMETALRRALEREEFVLHYQPQVDLASGCIVGAEALLRWLRPGDDGPNLVAPADFVPLLEETGLINAVGEWVLHEACRRTRQWQEDGMPAVRVAVNLSARQFQDCDIKALVRTTLDATGLAPDRLELELTEGIVLLNADAVIRTMRDLNAIGISHALDDFGTGYSSLSYLQRLPVARIKIDRAFVTHITSHPGDAAIARAVVGMAHSLGLGVIAEGVETEGQLGFLRGLGCEEMQGYLFSRPLPADEFTDLLRAGRGIAPAGNGKKERVLLLMDDEPHVLSALTRSLRGQGYRILATTSANEGFDLMAAHPVGVVVCDQRMPEMTGTEFLRRAKELHPDIMRIVLSGYTELNSVLDAVNRGAIYKFITKPWEEDVLAEGIRDAFRIYEMGHEHREMSRRLQELAAA